MAKLEIEYKFLIRKPAGLDRLERKELTQTYLVCKNGTARVRMVQNGDEKRYYFTHKKRISFVSCKENEWEITEMDYRLMLIKADPKRKTIHKTRYYYPYEGLLFEIDEYPFWQHQCVMEVELEQEGQSVQLPPDIEVIRDVTAEKQYKNFALARQVPEEEI